MTLPSGPSGRALAKAWVRKMGALRLDVEMRLPSLPIEGGERIPLETGGIVHEAGRRAERLGTSLDQGLKSV